LPKEQHAGVTQADNLSRGSNLFALFALQNQVSLLLTADDMQMHCEATGDQLSVA
jgi:hypothetical protein